MAVLRTHRNAIEYSLSDLKGIIPTIATHKLFLEDGAEPVVYFQRKLQPQMK
jgi:hypothetical protein